MNAGIQRAFGSLRKRNFRLFFLGQLVSISGTWMQRVAVAWLVVKLTHSAFELGLTTALESVPYLLFAAWGGLVADRVPRRRLLLITQTAHVVPALALWALSESHDIRMWIVYVVVIARGTVNSFDNPARQTFVAELVGVDGIVNAVSLNASVVQGGRLFGPAIAAVIIATSGLNLCFLINALTFVFMIAMLLLMRPEEFSHAPVTPRARGQLRAGLSLAMRAPELRVPLVMMAVVGLLTLNFNVVLPAIAAFTFHGTATTYAIIVDVVAAGALVGAVWIGARSLVTTRMIAWASLAFGVALAAAAATDVFWAALIALAVVGATSVVFTASVQSVLQLAVEPDMRGRIVALYQIVYQGTTPLGALIVGWLASTLGARSGLVLGAAAALVAGVGGLWQERGRGREPAEAPVKLGAPGSEPGG